jgi:hypothetical protein
VAAPEPESRIVSLILKRIHFVAFKILGGLGRLAPAAITLPRQKSGLLSRIFTQQDAEVNECVVTNVWSTSYRFPPTLSADAQSKNKGPERVRAFQNNIE